MSFSSWCQAGCSRSKFLICTVQQNEQYRNQHSFRNDRVQVSKWYCQKFVSLRPSVLVSFPGRVCQCYQDARISFAFAGLAPLSSSHLNNQSSRERASLPLFLLGYALIANPVTGQRECFGNFSTKKDYDFLVHLKASKGLK